MRPGCELIRWRLAKPCESLLKGRRVLFNRQTAIAYFKHEKGSLVKSTFPIYGDYDV